uniref:Uncharacterized protein n=1 Tax=Glossina pallidipes TaxID=7398 RepID=A0A1B0AEC2_GLOPL
MIKPSITCVKTFGLIIAFGKSFSALITLAPVVGFDGTEDVLIDFKLMVFVVVVLVVVLILLVTNVLLLVVDATELVAIMGAVLAAIVVPTLDDSPVSSGVVETTIAVDIIESDSLVDLIDFAGDVEFSDVSDTGVVSIGVTICWGISGRELLFAAVGVPVAIEETNVVVVKLEGVLEALKLAVRATVVGVLGALDTALTCSAATLLGVLGKDAEAFVLTPKMRDVSEYCHFVPLPSELLVSSAKAQQRLLQMGNHVAIDAIAEVAVIVQEIFAVAPPRVPLVALDSVLSPGFGHENILRVNINIITK